MKSIYFIIALALSFLPSCCYFYAPIYSSQSQTPSFVPSVYEGDSWVTINGVNDLINYDIEANGNLEQMHLDNAISVIANGTPSQTFLLRYHPLTISAEYVNWMALGGTQHLVNIYMGTGSEPGGCMMQLLPQQQDFINCGMPDETANNGVKPPKKKEDKKEEVKKPVVKDEDKDEEEEEAPSLDGEDEDGAPSLGIIEKPEMPFSSSFVSEFDGVRCGSISTIRSLLKMGWIDAKDAVEGDSLKASYVKGFDKYLSATKGMTSPNETKAHQDNLPKGKKFKTDEVHIHPIEKAENNRKSWQKVDSLLKAGCDCIITYNYIIENDDGPNTSVYHAEMLTKVTITGDNISADMENSYDQGSGSGKGILTKGKSRTKKYNIKHLTEKGKHVSPISINCYWAE